MADNSASGCARRSSKSTCRQRCGNAARSRAQRTRSASQDIAHCRCGGRPRNSSNRARSEAAASTSPTESGDFKMVASQGSSAMSSHSARLSACRRNASPASALQLLVALIMVRVAGGSGRAQSCARRRSIMRMRCASPASSAASARSGSGSRSGATPGHACSSRDSRVEPQWPMWKIQSSRGVAVAVAAAASHASMPTQ